MAVDAFPDHDGIVHQHAENQNEGQHRQGADLEIDIRKHGDGAEQRDGNAGGHPHGEAEPQEERQYDQHERQAAERRGVEHTHALLEFQRIVGPDGQLQAFGQGWAHRGDVSLHVPGDLHDVFGVELRYLEHHRGLAVEAGEEVAFLESVAYVRDLAQGHVGAVLPGEHDHALKLLSPVGLPLGAQQDFAVPRLDGTARHVERAVAHGMGDLIEGQAVPAQRVFRNLDGNLVGAYVGDGHLRYAVDGGKFVPQLLCDLLEDALVRIAGQRRVQYVAMHGHHGNGGFFRLHRKTVDGIDPALYFVQGDNLVGVDLKFRIDDAGAFAGDRVNLVDARNALDGFLDADAYALFDFFRRRTEVGHGDGDDGNVERRELFLIDGENRKEATDTQDGHQQVGGNRIAREPGDCRVHGLSPRRPRSG